MKLRSTCPTRALSRYDYCDADAMSTPVEAFFGRRSAASFSGWRSLQLRIGVPRKQAILVEATPRLHSLFRGAPFDTGHHSVDPERC